jgi:hypothetical protein
MDSIGIEATSKSSGDIHSFSLPLMIVFLILVLLIGILSSRTLRSGGIAVHHLFLKILLKRAGKELVGFVRTLDVDTVGLVMTEGPTRGELLELNLSSLPGFPLEKTVVIGRVAQVKPLGGANHNYLVQIKLKAPEPAAKIQDSMITYIDHLHA